MTATLSSVRMNGPALWQFGIWRPDTLLRHSGKARARLTDQAAGWLAEWHLARERLLTPWQAGRALFLLATLALLLSAGFWLMGVAVAPLACLQLAGIGMVLAMWVRHADDRDVIALRPGLLRVERHRAGRVDTVEFNPRWVRVEPDQHDESLVRLSGHGLSVVVGDFVQRQHRRQLADEFRWALRHLDGR